MTGSQDKNHSPANQTLLMQHSPQSCDTPSRDGAYEQHVAARLTAVSRESFIARARPATEMFNPGENIQPAMNAHEDASEQGQLHSSSRVAGPFCINAGSFHRITHLLIMEKTQPSVWKRIHQYLLIRISDTFINTGLSTILRPFSQTYPTPPRSSTVHHFTSGSSKQVVDLTYLCLAQRPILHRNGILLHLLGRLEVRDRNGCAASRRNPSQCSALKS